MKTPLLLALAAALLTAQPKKLADAQVQTRAVAAGQLNAVLQSLASAQPQPAWAAYTVPAARGRNFGCDGYWRDHEMAVAGGVVHLEPPREVMVLVRFHDNQISQLRTLAPDCEIAAGGVPFHWLTGVRPEESVAALQSFIKPASRLADSAIHALGLHAGPAADAALEKLLARDQPESIRASAVRWIGTTRGRRGVELLRPVIEADPSERVRRSALSALASSKDPLALDILLATTKNGNSSLRGQALGALARHGGPQALAAIQSALDQDTSRDLRKSALSALRSLPDGAGIPPLIQAAQSHRDPDVRKQAMSSLSQSKDPRAVAFFESVLRSR